MSESDATASTADQVFAALQSQVADVFGLVGSMLRLSTDRKAADAALAELKRRAEQITADRQTLDCARAAFAEHEQQARADLEQRTTKLDALENDLLLKEREQRGHLARVREACAIGREQDEMLRRRFGRLAGIFDDNYVGTLSRPLPNWDAIELELGIGGDQNGQTVEDSADLLPPEPVEYAPAHASITRSRPRRVGAAAL